MSSAASLSYTNGPLQSGHTSMSSSFLSIYFPRSQLNLGLADRPFPRTCRCDTDENAGGSQRSNCQPALQHLAHLPFAARLQLRAHSQITVQRVRKIAAFHRVFFRLQHRQAVAETNVWRVVSVMIGERVLDHLPTARASGSRSVPAGRQRPLPWRRTASTTAISTSRANA